MRKFFVFGIVTLLLFQLWFMVTTEWEHWRKRGKDE